MPSKQEIEIEARRSSAESHENSKHVPATVRVEPLGCLLLVPTFASSVAGFFGATSRVLGLSGAQLDVLNSFIHSFIHSFIGMVPEEEKEQRKGDSQRPNPSIRHSVARPSTASLARLRVENGDAPELDNCVYAWARACVRI